MLKSEKCAWNDFHSSNNAWVIVIWSLIVFPHFCVENSTTPTYYRLVSTVIQHKKGGTAVPKYNSTAVQNMKYCSTGTAMKSNSIAKVSVLQMAGTVIATARAIPAILLLLWNWYPSL